MLTINQISEAYAIPPDEVELTLAAFDAYTLDLTTPCWVGGPRKFRIGRKTHNPLRALGATAKNRELDSMWRLHRKCGTIACRNLLHYELCVFYDPEGVLEPEDLPE